VNPVPNKYCNLCGYYHHKPTQPCGEVWFPQALAAASSPEWQWKQGAAFLRDGGYYSLLADWSPGQPLSARERCQPPVWWPNAWEQGPMIPDMSDASTRALVLAVTAPEEGAA
jgi:hypothetical protein